MNKKIKIPHKIIKEYANRNKISVTYSRQIHKKLVIALDYEHFEGSMHEVEEQVKNAWKEFVLESYEYYIFCLGRYERMIFYSQSYKYQKEFTIIESASKNGEHITDREHFNRKTISIN